MREKTKAPSVVGTTDMSEQLRILQAKQQFLSAAMGMGWQLAGAVLLPVFIGVKLDVRFHASPSYTLAALVVACVGAVAIVSSTIKRVNLEQASSTDLKVETHPKKDKHA